MIRRFIRNIFLLAFLVLLAFAVWMIWTGHAGPSAQRTLDDTIHSAITNTAEFARTRFTGGVGAVLLADPATGEPLVNQVLGGSPAEKAGLQPGDRIVQVDGVPTKGRTLVQNVESIRGSALGSVALVVQRDGSNTIQCVIHRSSWRNLGVTN